MQQAMIWLVCLQLHNTFKHVRASHRARSDKKTGISIHIFSTNTFLHRTSSCTFRVFTVAIFHVIFHFIFRIILIILLPNTRK
ncbi:hypothetical protein L208DRAFT_432297 [Tricholoma matsutake]|nr:hypothetical protein L208DRAFT_432297 [Tricholoma matsutake 945]